MNSILKTAFIPFIFLSCVASSQAQIAEPSAQRVEPSAKRVEPSAQEIEPSAKRVEPSAQEEAPSTQTKQPTAATSEINKDVYPALTSAMEFVIDSFFVLDFEGAATRMDPNMKMDPYKVRLIISQMVRYGFPHSFAFTHYKEESAGNMMSFYGRAVSTQLTISFKTQVLLNGDGQYFLKGFAVSPNINRWSEGQERLPIPRNIVNSPFSSTTKEFAAWMLREPVLHFPNNDFISIKDTSYEPALSVYQKIYKDEWILEVEYRSEFEAEPSEAILAEAETAFINNISRIGDKAGVSKMIMAALKPGSDKVYRILFEKKARNQWVRTSS